MLSYFIRKIGKKRADTVYKRIKPYLKKSKRILDIGSGSGFITEILRSKGIGINVTPVDVADFHGPRIIKPVIYDGVKLPFSDKSYDVALLLMVLHHTPNPKVVFLEAARVAKEIVVIETSYTNKINRISTIISDAIGNLRLEAFWGSYKTDIQWKQFFNSYGFIIKDSQQFIDKQFGVIPFLHIVYYLGRK